jgi:hypothetical protein
MKNNFYSFVDNEIQKALPPSWKRVPKEELLGKSSCKIRQAFHSAPIYGKSRLINILTLPLSLELNDLIEFRLLELRDCILASGCMLVVISEEEHANQLADMGIFIDDHLLINSPDFLWITCNRDHGYKTTVASEIFEDLHTIIHDLWKGVLRYNGPTAGLQQVNLELMQDGCPKCRKPITTVTGLVFPDVQLEHWDNADWLYYNQLLPLFNITGETARSIQQFVTLLRKVDTTITPIRKRYCHMEQTNYTAAICPYCKAPRGDFDVAEDRMQYLHSLESRITGHLKYYSISLNIDQELIDSLTDGFECCPHTLPIGWERK